MKKREEGQKRERKKREKRTKKERKRERKERKRCPDSIIINQKDKLTILAEMLKFSKSCCIYI